MPLIAVFCRKLGSLPSVRSGLCRKMCAHFTTCAVEWVSGAGSPYEVRIVGPNECVPANEVILADNTLGDLAGEVRDQLSGDASRDWYIIAEVENGNYLVIDFGRRHTGRCYDAFWETYATPGQMPVVATSLTALIQRLYEHRGRHWYWLQPEFERVGDAYDFA